MKSEFEKFNDCNEKKLLKKFEMKMKNLEEGGMLKP